MNGRAIVALCGVAAVCVAAGCLSYANYPPVPRNVAVNNPNNPAMDDVMMAGLRWVVAKYPPGPEGTPFAVNLPRGVKPNVYRRGAAVAEGGQPLTPENVNLPTYHIGEIRVRGDQANIWIYRPVVALGSTPQGKPVYQEVKLWLQGGLSPWHVVNALDRTPGATEIPEPNFYEPEPEPVVRPSKEDPATFTPKPKPKQPPKPPPPKPMLTPEEAPMPAPPEQGPPLIVPAPRG